MKHLFNRKYKNKLISTAVAAACVGGLGVQGTAHALVDSTELGQLALVPYYTVRGNFVTGVHIINTGNATQAVKFRMRRAEDSADALDIVIILSPHDEWTGFISGSEQDGITLGSDDKTCTAPAADANGKWLMPAINRAGAGEGYIEIISMGRAYGRVAQRAKHVNGVPVDCDEVRENFFSKDTGPGGVISNSETQNFAGVSTPWTAPANELKVSYFIRDPQSGMEFGNNAVHIKGFTAVPMMTNQELGLSDGKTDGFDFPDLNGGGAGTPRDKYDSVIRADLGGIAIVNDWSKNGANGVTTDWIVTIPGQYLMYNPDPADDNPATVAIDERDHRDLPVTANVHVWDREEKGFSSRDLVISPHEGPGDTTLPDEVNIIRWGDQSIFESVRPRTITGFDAPYGWAKVSLASANKVGGQLIYDFTVPVANDDGVAPLNPVPVIGYAAWRRTFNNAEKNYGRIIEHSRMSQ